MFATIRRRVVGGAAVAAIGLVLPGTAASAGPAAFAGVVQAPSPQRMAVPAYFYPGPLWKQMDQAHPRPQIAIMNPASGPGMALDPHYVSAVRAAQAAGILVLGYDHTSYGARPPTDVKADVDKYYSWYGVDGIFFDEASTDCAHQPYYADLNAYVKGKAGLDRTILNPGTQTNECYVTAADILLTFEGSDASYLSSYTAPPWVANYPSNRFWHVVYATPTVAAMIHAVGLSEQRQAGYVYVTADTLPNPYDTLPTGTYWSRELAALAA